MAEDSNKNEEETTTDSEEGSTSDEDDDDSVDLKMADFWFAFIMLLYSFWNRFAILKSFCNHWITFNIIIVRSEAKDYCFLGLIKTIASRDSITWSFCLSRDRNPMLFVFDDYSLRTNNGSRFLVNKFK